MPNDWIEEEALRFEGYNDQQIAQFKASLPKLQQLIGLVTKNEKDIETAILLVKELLPVADMAVAVLRKRITTT